MKVERWQESSGGEPCVAADRVASTLGDPERIDHATRSMFVGSLGQPTGTVLNAHSMEAQASAALAIQAKTDFLANISHEIRTPMTADYSHHRIRRNAARRW